MQLSIPISDPFWGGCLKGVSDVKGCEKTCYNNLADPEMLSTHLYPVVQVPQSEPLLCWEWHANLWHQPNDSDTKLIVEGICT